MIEENVVRAAGVEYRLKKEEMTALIEDLGFEAMQRDCYYNILKGSWKMKEKDFYEDDDWDEEDWERFLQKADVRTAKYMELFETLHNHPECRQHYSKRDGLESEI